jgi:hypothetical protein
VAWGNQYLRLFDLDLDDETAIADWCAAVGPMGWCWRPLPVGGEREWVGISGPLGAAMDGSRAYARLAAARTASGDMQGVEVFETVEEFRLAASLLRDVTRLWLEAREHISAGGVVDQDERIRSVAGEFEVDWLAELGLGVSESLATLEPLTRAQLLGEYLTPMLGQFQPTFGLRGLDDGDDDERAQHISPFACMAAEIYLDARGRAAYRRCKNETCGRWFTHQHGRAEHGQHRSSGVLYCTDRCARAQAQREYRRRKRRNGTAAP